MLFLLSFSLLLTCSLSQNASHWFEGGLVFVSFPSGLNQSSAEEYCRKTFNNHSLVTLNTPESITNIETAYITAENASELYGVEYWIGLKRSGTCIEGSRTVTAHWIWLSGVNYTNSQAYFRNSVSEPDFCATKCVRSAGKWDSHRWGDTGCHNIFYGFGCDIDTISPTNNPTNIPSIVSNNPTITPTINPTSITNQPTINPSINPSTVPSKHPTFTSNPSVNPTQNTINPSKAPTIFPTLLPTILPTIHPSNNPTTNPISTDTPSITPSFFPSQNPTHIPTNTPSNIPSHIPSNNPSIAPTNFNPSITPSFNPSITPTINPTINPSFNPSINPTIIPTLFPTLNPTMTPTITDSKNTNQSIIILSDIILVLSSVLFTALLVFGCIYGYRKCFKPKKSVKQFYKKGFNSLKLDIENLTSISYINNQWLIDKRLSQVDTNLQYTEERTQLLSIASASNSEVRTTTPINTQTKGGTIELGKVNKNNSNNNLNEDDSESLYKDDKIVSDVYKTASPRGNNSEHDKYNEDDNNIVNDLNVHTIEGVKDNNNNKDNINDINDINDVNDIDDDMYAKDTKNTQKDGNETKTPKEKTKGGNIKEGNDTRNEPQFHE